MRLGSKKANFVDTNTMTRQVLLYAPTRTADGQGGYTTTFALQSTIWGDLRPNNQARAISEGKLDFDASATLYIRYGAIVTDAYEIEIESVRYTIHSIKNVENQNRFLELVIYR